MINLGYKLDFELTKDAHFVALSGNLWGDYSEYFE